MVSRVRIYKIIAKRKLKKPTIDSQYKHHKHNKHLLQLSAKIKELIILSVRCHVHLCLVTTSCSQMQCHVNALLAIPHHQSTGPK